MSTTAGDHGASRVKPTTASQHEQSVIEWSSAGSVAS